MRVEGGCGSCGTGDGTLVRDKNGRVIRRQGADGYVTRTLFDRDHVLSEEQYLRPAGCDPQTDSQHCRLGTSDLATVVLEASSATVKTTYEYTDTNWPDKLTATSKPSVLSPTGLVREERTADLATIALSEAADEETTARRYYNLAAACELADELTRAKIYLEKAASIHEKLGWWQMLCRDRWILGKILAKSKNIDAGLVLLCHFSIRSSGKCCPRRLKRLRRRSIRSSGVRSRRGR